MGVEMDIIELLKVVFLGIVEGITEWLPISSTGHMILVDEFVKLKVSPEFWEMFLVVIQLGAVLAVVFLDFKKLWPFHRMDPDRESNWNYISEKSNLAKVQHFSDKYVYMSKIVLWLKIMVSCVPAIIIGLPFNDWIETHFNNYRVVSVTLIIYGILFIIIENYNKSRKPTRTKLSEITFKDALIIGVFQLLSVIPGTSRSGATIIGGILIGMSRKLAAEYTFFLAIPVMFGASLLKIVKFGFHFTGTEVVFLLLGMVVAFVVSIFAIKFLMSYIQKHDFKVFGWYRIALGVLVLGYFLIKML
jgi:undecaprenyl-diphosphatase